ncbi:MAG: DUF4384 domain-containing protein [Acidobacteria bacterium]|nr:DUF4384 domain-containing protein [Acidobacteriota bacterium]
MRSRFFVPLLAIALTAGYSMTALRAQEDPNEEAATRGAFITSRAPVSGGVGASATVSSGNKSSGSKANSKSSGRTGGRTPASSSRNSSRNTSKGTTASVSVVKNYSNTPIGLGYTLYMRNSMGDAVRVDPDREFHQGDGIRLSMESNTDGYLYVFHTENDGPPELIYPDARINDGDNWMEAHVPYEVPSPFEQREGYRWFFFDDKPANERLYVVVTREPIPGIPTGDDLVKFCNRNPNSCPLRMPAADWAKVKASMNARVKVSKSKTYGQKQTSGEREATTRGLGLDQSAPEPSVVRMSASTTDSILVTALDLVHR